ncbi:hypothetical protein [Embleya sp. NPDC059237]|uniref:hypothetical protein n=1 Tax=Embleya sp. NPDC059237 TaxID=3346784 RepID=UPI0036913CC3
MHQNVDATYWFSNVSNNLCLVARAQQEARQIGCSGAQADADWYTSIIDPNDPQWVQLVNKATGNCLVPQNGNLNVPFMQATCSYTTNPPADQRWRFTNF